MKTKGYVMKVLVLGATGATGRWAVKTLLSDGHEVIALVRSAATLQGLIGPSTLLSVIEETALSIPQERLSAIVSSCDAVICCLGHTLSWKGVYGAPHMLVRDSLKRVCESVVHHPAITTDPGIRKQPLRVVLMNSTGCRNLDLSEPISFAQYTVLALLRLMLPPHVDNERAGNYLRLLNQSNVKLSESIEWVVVRPDALIDDAEATDYELHPSPIRSAIFDSGKTSRVNAGCFMSELVTNNGLWKAWKGKMPVIYNAE